MEQMDISKMESERIALIMAQQYQMIMQANNNIMACTAELNKRLDKPIQVVTEESKFDGKRD